MTEQPMGWDEATRPTFPVPDGVSYTPRQRAAPQHLVEVHDALRAELEQLRVIVQEVADGALQVGSSRVTTASRTAASSPTCARWRGRPP